MTAHDLQSAGETRFVESSPQPIAPSDSDRPEGPSLSQRFFASVSPKGPRPRRLSRREQEALEQERIAEELRVAERQRADDERRAAEERIDRRNSSMSMLQDLSRDVPQFTVAFIAVKGGAATTTTMVHCASIAADVTRSLVVASDFNPASGTAGIALGKDHDMTMKLAELRDHQDKYVDPAHLLAEIRPTRYGVRVVSANNYVAGHSEDYGDDARHMLDLLARHAEYHFIDTANDITTTSSRQVLDAADLYVFTANAALKRSLLLLSTSMEAARSMGFADKVDRSVVVISNKPDDKDLEDYQIYLNRVDSRDQVIQEYNFDGPFTSVPSDPWVALDGEVDLSQLGWETYQAYLDIVVTLFQQAHQVRDNRSAPTSHDS